jgi:hypothetical protein
MSDEQFAVECFEEALAKVKTRVEPMKISALACGWVVALCFDVGVPFDALVTMAKKIYEHRAAQRKGETS